MDWDFGFERGKSEPDWVWDGIRLAGMAFPNVKTVYA